MRAFLSKEIKFLIKILKCKSLNLKTYQVAHLIHWMYRVYKPQNIESETSENYDSLSFKKSVWNMYLQITETKYLLNQVLLLDKPYFKVGN